MKQTVATSLLLGYILLVPFCFFGATAIANAETMNMIGNPAHQMNDCGMPLGGCAHSTGAGPADSVAHHIGIYNSITQTPLAALSIMMTIVLALLLSIFALSFNWLSILFPQQNFLQPIARRTDEQRSNTEQSTLTWLSLFETSPNFA